MATPSSTMPVLKKLWEHPEPQKTEMARFMKTVNQKRNRDMQVEIPSVNHRVVDALCEVVVDMYRCRL